MTLSPMLHSLGDKLSHWLELLVVMLPNLVGALLVVAVASLAARWVGRLTRRLLERVTHNPPISNLLGKVAGVAMRLVGVFVALGLLRLDKTVTSLLAGVGVIGLALGFAFQDIAANFMSGIFMALRRPFAPGDLVELAGRKAIVEAVELRATTVTTLDGLWIQVPNKDVFQSPIINYTKTESRRMDLAVGVAYCDDLTEVQRVARRAVSDLARRDEERDVEVFFTGFGESSIDLQVRIWLTSARERDFLEARSNAIMAIKRAFDEAQITIPFPIRTLDFGARTVGGARLDDLQLAMVRSEAAE
ncbi:MAG: mechanosensitive ion channel family protein [Myxococcales bacterium]|nr:mechanosensitive ion channel family protein [Myxococcales bacterium]